MRGVMARLLSSERMALTFDTNYFTVSLAMIGQLFARLYILILGSQLTALQALKTYPVARANLKLNFYDPIASAHP